MTKKKGFWFFLSVLSIINIILYTILVFVGSDINTYLLIIFIFIISFYVSIKKHNKINKFSNNSNNSISTTRNDNDFKNDNPAQLDLKSNPIRTKLPELDMLKKEGLLTEDEYEKKRQQIIDKY